MQGAGNKAGEAGPSGGRRQGGCSGLGGRMELLGCSSRGSRQPRTAPPSWPEQPPQRSPKAPRSPSTLRNPLPGRFSESNTSGGRLRALISTLMAVLSSPSPWSRAGDARRRYPRAGLISPIIPADGLSSGALPVRHGISC